MLSYAGRNAGAINQLKTMYFDHPEWTPCGVGLLPATWMRHRERLEEVILAHPKVFPAYRRGQKKDFDEVYSPLYEEGRFTDAWGTVWENRHRGFDSYIADCPLQEWDAMRTWQPPSPDVNDLQGTARNWEQLRQHLAERRKSGHLAQVGPLMHGFMYMRMYYLRGFENFMMDLASDDPRIHTLLAIVRDYNRAVVGKCIEAEAEYLTFGDDLGLQRSLPMSPAMWRRFIKPCYDAILEPCRDRGLPVYLHTDGHILEIIGDLKDVGVTVINPQIGANGIEGLKEVAKGKIAMNVDLDRQLLPFATPSQIEDHIGEVYENLYMPEGGLMFVAECGPDVSLEKIDRICRTFERLCNLPEVTTA